MGQGTLYKVQTGDPIPDADCNSLSAAMVGDIVPRDPTSFEATDIGAKMGTGALRWDDTLFEKIFIGLTASGLEIDEEVVGLSKNFLIKSLGNVICRILASGSIDRSALGPVNKVLGNITASYSAVPAAGAVTYSTLNITTSGRPVMVLLNSLAAGSNLEIGTTPGTNSDPVAEYFIKRDGATIYDTYQYGESQGFGTSIISSRIPASSIWTFDTPAAGTHTYDFQTACVGAYAAGQNIQLMAYELS